MVHCFTLSLQERRYEMSKLRFRVEKSSYYSGGKKENEEFTIYGYGDMLCSGVREDIEELYEQLTMALNDHKETKNEKAAK
jgi:hypothetical protein|nr:MAG TPA: hypothetical protein [Phycodnaviridae sp.]